MKRFCLLFAISIHAPRTGSDITVTIAVEIHEVFQSTLPARGATTPQEVTLTSKTFQSTLPARGATADKRCNQLRKRFQSTLPARGATVSAVYNFLYEKFQSTLPARGATIPTEEMTDPDGISIHAPRTGSDAHGGKPASARRDFNPRSPHGERRTQVMTTSSSLTFQSTLPARGATMKQERASRICLFQSTLPARGATVSSNSIIKTKTFQSTLPARGATPTISGSLASSFDFNPRSPHGERLRRLHRPADGIGFQSTLPARGATVDAVGVGRSGEISIHAPRTGSDGSDCTLPGSQ